jgi:antitoxin component YwqK of YwqJK toxin-antitoxin module
VRYKGYFVGKTPQGEVTHFYPTGEVKAVMQHAGETTEAVLRSRDGKFATRGKYAKQKKEGEWSYYAGEKLVLKEAYKSDKLDGVSYRYDENGGIVEMRTWQNGVLQGAWEMYYDNGKKRFEAFYVDGKLNGVLKSYLYKGELSVEGRYENDLKEGAWKYYAADSTLQKEINYTQGVSADTEAEELNENKEIDGIITEGRKIADPANFIDAPEVYMQHSK